MNYEQLKSSVVSALTADNSLSFDSDPAFRELVALLAMSSGEPVFTAPTGFTANVIEHLTANHVGIFSTVQSWIQPQPYTVSRNPSSVGDFAVVELTLPAPAVFYRGTGRGGANVTSLTAGFITDIYDSDAIAVTGLRLNDSSPGIAVSDGFTLTQQNNRMAIATKPLSIQAPVSVTWSWDDLQNGGCALAIFGVKVLGVAVRKDALGYVTY